MHLKKDDMISRLAFGPDFWIVYSLVVSQLPSHYWFISVLFLFCQILCLLNNFCYPKLEFACQLISRKTLSCVSSSLGVWALFSHLWLILCTGFLNHSLCVFCATTLPTTCYYSSKNHSPNSYLAASLASLVTPVSSPCLISILILNSQLCNVIIVL